VSKSIAILRLLAIMLGLASAANAATVKYDHDKSVDMRTWRYMTWASEAGDPSMKEQRIDDAVAAGFAARGYFLVAEREGADFLIQWRAAAWQDVRLEGTAWSPAFGRDLRLAREAMGTLVVTVVERKTGKVAWRGMVTDALASDPEKADRRTAKAVEKLLKKFPARGEGQ
jgi:hypothetical protein